LLLVLTLVSGVKPDPQINPTGLDIVYPKAQAYELGQDFNIYIMVNNFTTGLNIDNTTASCVLYVSNHSNNDIVVSEDFTYYGNNIFKAEISNSSFEIGGFYPYVIYCNTTTAGGFISDEILISVDGAGELTTGNGFLAVALILLPLFFSLILMKWVGIIGEGHEVFRLAMSLLSLTLVYVSLWFSALSVIKFFFWNEMTEALTMITEVLGWVFFAIISYFIIVMIYNIFVSIGKKKAERFEL
jgi:hypothetical protein